MERIKAKGELKKLEKQKEIRSLDKNFDLTDSHIKELVDKYPEMSAQMLFLREKYNTPEKIKLLARSLGGDCLSSKFNGVTTIYSWICKFVHSARGSISWLSSLDTVLNGSWCHVCRSENPDLLDLQAKCGIVGLTSDNLSKGNRACREYFKKRGIEFITEKSFFDLRYINCLRFDFYIPSLNLLIEFDGKQHFVPVEYFGGYDTFKVQVIKDNIKANYCMKNKIRLIRINKIDSVEKDLDILIAHPDIDVMYVVIDAEIQAISGGNLKTDKK